MQLNPYLMYDGNCEEAFKHYAKVLGGQLMLQRYGEAPGCESMPENGRDKIIHARLDVDGQVLMASDCPPNDKYEGVKGCSVAINVSKPEEVDRIFTELGQGGSVLMPPEETFWARRFAMFSDRFGVSWMANCATEH
ncbi:VOC family protein [Lysobacter fragariae]